MDITLEKVNTDVKPPKDDTELVSRISKLWDRFDQDREKQRTIIDKVQEHRDFSNNNKLGDVKEIAESKKAHIWNSMFKSLASSFTCNVADDRDKEFANIQKANILNALEKSKADEEFLKALDNLIYKGEFITFTTWITKYKKVRRKVDVPVYDELTGEQTGTEKVFQVFQEPSYEGVRIKAVSPENFVFDTTRSDDLDSCTKIYKSWATYYEIEENKTYNLLDKTKLKELYEITKGSDERKDNTNLDADEYTDRDKGIKDDQLEVLEYWGDIRIGDEYLKNMLIVVVGRRYIARFEYNPYIINPFVWCPDELDPDSGRGIPKIFDIVKYNNDATEIFETQKEALGLIIQKPMLAPKGSLSGNIKVEKGKIIEYDPALMPQMPQPLDYKDALVGWDFLSYFEKKCEQLSGMTKYATGDQSGIKRTATEANHIMVGTNVRLALDISILGKKGLIPTIERVAELLANFKDETETIKIISNGQEVFKEVDNNVRHGKYNYSLGDSQSIIETKSKIQEQITVAKEFANGGLKLKLPQLWEYVMGKAYEMENPMSFIENDPLDDILNQLPEEIKEPVKQALSSYVPVIAQQLIGGMNGQPPETTSPINPKVNAMSGIMG